MLRTCLFLWVSLLSGHLWGQVRFSMPLKGMAGKDFYIVHYADHRWQDRGLKDVYCGRKTYDGHKGTDMMLSGYASMDTGVVIYAAADGRVFETADGYYDRRKKAIWGEPWNYVAIRHSEGISTFYGHMAKGSVMVKEGDSVREGQPIGKVGSSGYSAFPHLHFEVKKTGGQTIDPFWSTCIERTYSYWKEQPAYDTSVFAVKSGFVPYIPGYDTLQEGYLVTDTFHVLKDTTVCFWVLAHGLHEGDVMRAEWYNPRQKLHASHTWDLKHGEWFSYTWPSINMPTTKGKWLAQLFVNNVPVASRYFYVVR